VRDALGEPGHRALERDLERDVVERDDADPLAQRGAVLALGVTAVVRLGTDDVEEERRVLPGEAGSRGPLPGVLEVGGTASPLWSSRTSGSSSAVSRLPSDGSIAEAGSSVLTAGPTARRSVGPSGTSGTAGVSPSALAPVSAGAVPAPVAAVWSPDVSPAAVPAGSPPPPSLVHAAASRAAEAISAAAPLAIRGVSL
jgi:hypothetical protein